MSYLDLPRIHFAGQFTTGPSTINNTTTNFNIARPLGRPGWNPDGPAFFNLSACTVQSVVQPDTSTDPNDTLVGKTLTSTDNWGDGGVPAKIVDLDPQQQMVSMLYGLQLQIGEGENSVIVDFEPVWFQDYIVSAAYQSVLVRPQWGTNLTSATLIALKACSPELLSIKFTLAAGTFYGPPASRSTGPIFGTIGPGEASQPTNFVKGRLLRPVGSTQNLNFAPAIVQDKRLTLDLLNAVPQSDIPPALGTLNVSFIVPNGPTYPVGIFDYSEKARKTNALIQDFDLSCLSDAEYDLLLDSPVSVGNGPQQAMFQEDESGRYVNASPYVFRLQANSTAPVHLWAGRFGIGQQGINIFVEDASNRLPSGLTPPVGVAPNGTPLSFSPGSGTTDANGDLTVILDAGNPNNPRDYIDGQVYALSFHLDPPTKLPDINTFLSILVHDEFTLPPTWASIEPIMQQYARLYPFMSFVPLTDPVKLVTDGWVPKLIKVFSYPIDDPRYMPVVRDLSQDKKNAILGWLKSQ